MVTVVASAFSRLIDYAGLFPPAKLEMDPALVEYEAARAGKHAWMLGRFITPLSRVEELLGALHAGTKGFPLSVIVDAPLDARAWFGAATTAFERVAKYRASQPAIAVACLEVPLPPLASARETHESTIGQASALVDRFGLRDLPVFLEVPRDGRYLELLPNAMTALTRYRLGAKVRCGGVVPTAFPSVEDVAAFIVAAREASVPFKATAGLHHPVRHYNEAAGVTMHGFLNILAATAFAAEGAGVAQEIIADENPQSFAFEDGTMRWREWTASAAEVERARTNGFVAYGSCSFDEPVEDLSALRILQ